MQESYQAYEELAAVKKKPIKCICCLFMFQLSTFDHNYECNVLFREGIGLWLTENERKNVIEII